MITRDFGINCVQGVHCPCIENPSLEYINTERIWIKVKSEEKCLQGCSRGASLIWPIQVKDA